MESIKNAYLGKELRSKCPETFKTEQNKHSQANSGNESPFDGKENGNNYELKVAHENGAQWQYFSTGPVIVFFF